MDALLSCQALTKHFAKSRRLGEALRGRRRMIRAVDGVSFAVATGEAVGLLGESGCGKTTLGRLLLRLTAPSSGTIAFAGQPLAGLAGAELRRFRQEAQLVFQNPFDALNPRFTILRSLSEPLVNARIAPDARGDYIRRALARVRLPDDRGFLDKYPHQMSGGQLQRIVLARALMLEPRFILADEPVSMLDVSVRAGILNVMREVQGSLGLAAVYISHDLALIRYVCERALVMYLGKIVEDGPTEAVVRAPQHPYTKALVLAVPVPHVDQPRDPLPIRGNVADAANPPSGCRFRDRCPYAMARCAAEEPPLREIAPRHRVACHLLAA